MHELLHAARQEPSSAPLTELPVLFVEGKLTRESLDFVQGYVRKISRWPFAKTESPYPFEASDVEQVAMMHVLDGIKALELRSVAQLKGWLKTVTLNAFNDLVRQNRAAMQEGSIEDPGENTESSSPKGWETHSFGSFKLLDKQILVDELMQGLTDREKDIVWRRHAEEQTIGEIADALGCSLAQVKYTLERTAQQMIRRSLKRK